VRVSARYLTPPPWAEFPSVQLYAYDVPRTTGIGDIILDTMGRLAIVVVIGSGYPGPVLKAQPIHKPKKKPVRIWPTPIPEEDER
jgi:hypothetical protein